MNWTRGVVLGLAALGAAGCDQLGWPPAQTESTPAPAPAAPAADPALQGHAGESYSDFAAAMEGRYAPEALGLNAADRARLWRAMAVSTGALMEGGGAQALVFRGCAANSCADGVGIVAIDTATGAAFAGVVDAGGEEIFLPNERIEALLRLSSPTRGWHDPEPTQPQAALPGPEAAPP